jgi:3-oxoacyl-[acyl-carrier protein] reductase
LPNLRRRKSYILKVDSRSALTTDCPFAGTCYFSVHLPWVASLLIQLFSTEEQYRRLFDTNVLGAMLTIQQALKYFGPNGGSIINISSVASVSPTPGSGVYAATKAAVNTLTTVLGMELGGRKIRVNAIAPGPVDTEGTRGVGLIGNEVEKQLVAQTLLGRLGQPADIGRIAVFLASDDAGWVSGAWIRASGGLQ